MYDECIFYSNNGKQEVWTNRKLSLHKKENGHSIMVSKFLMEKCNRLKLNLQQCQENPSILKLEFIFNWKKIGTDTRQMRI